jgi:hypothetical protein
LELKEGSLRSLPVNYRLRTFLAIHFNPSDTMKLTTAPIVARMMVFVTSPD